MSVSTFIDYAPQFPPALVDLHQFERTEANIHCHDQSSFSRANELAQERASTFFQHLEKELTAQNGRKFSTRLERQDAGVFQPIRCFSGVFGGTLGSLLTNNPFPLLVGLGACIPPVHAQQKLRNEFRVNTYITDDQRVPSTAGLNNGNFVVIWQSFGQDGSGEGIFAQLFDENGEKLGNEFQVNTFTNNSQNNPSSTSFSTNNFLVTWMSWGQDGSWYGVYGQLFGENGNKIGSEFQVNTYIDSNQGSPSVASFNNENFVVVWESLDQDGDNYGIFGQLFNHNALKLRTEFQVNTFTVGLQRQPAITCFSNNNFVVVWVGNDRTELGIFGQLFNGNLDKIGTEFQINTYEIKNQRYPSVISLRNNNFVVTWESDEQDGSNGGVFGQLFNASGSKIGAEFPVNTLTNSSQYFPSSARLMHDNFVVVWSSTDSVFGQLFHRNASKSGNEFQINTFTNFSLGLYPSVSALRNNNFVVSWTSLFQDTNNSCEVYGQVFHDNLTIPFSYSSSDVSSQVKTLNVSESTPHKRFRWLWLLLGLGGGAGCLAMVGYFLKKIRRERQEAMTSTSAPLETFRSSTTDVEASFPLERSEKDHTRIGGRYDLINKISREEAAALYAQTGITIEFPEGQKKTKILFGQGNFGKLRLARDLHGRYLGVKKIKGEDEITQSRSEGSLQAKLSGKPNIMPILDFVESTSSQNQPVLYQFMPLAGFGNGETLRDHLQALTDPARKEQILTHVAKGLLTGLSYMHQSHIYHLDMKPSNIVLDIQGETFIIDFGCAQELPDGLIREEMTGDIEYYSPERIRFFRQVSRRQQPDPIAAEKIDAWALGLTLLKLVLGYYPFDRTGFFAKIKHWDNEYFQAKLDTIPLLKNPAPGSLLSIIKGLLDVDPQRRLSIEEALAQLAHRAPFSSPSQQQAVFADLKQQKPSAAASPAPPVPRNEDERYADVCIRKYGYGFTPDTVAPPGYAWTPDFVHPASSSQASSARPPVRIPPSYEEVMRAE